MVNYIITHIKADFDAIASAYAAALLHDGKILLMTEPEANVMLFFKDHFNGFPDRVKLINTKDKNLIKHIDNIVITDCNQYKRLGALGTIIAKSDKTIIYDHHPKNESDIAADEYQYSDCGSSVTLVLEKLFKSGKTINKTEATLFILGIYEDTGTLTFPTTKVSDITAVAELLKTGGDISAAGKYINREYSREQVFVLNELLMNMGTLSIDNHKITYSFASVDAYINELAYIAHKLMDMEKLESLFILIRSDTTISFIARSKTEAIDAGKIAAVFGGGGHPYAASASIKDLELHEALELLKVTLREQIKPVKFLREVMSSPAKYVNESLNLKEALDFFVHHNLNYLPVVKDQKTVGILSRKDIIQAIKHGLSDEPVATLMHVEFETFTPDTPFREAEYTMVVNNQKLLPVEHNDQLVGVVTKTDLLRLMQEEYNKRSSYEEEARQRLGLSRKRQIKDLLKQELNPNFYNYLEEIGELATNEGVGAYVVGGFVRDILMGKQSLDMDVVFESDAVLIAVQYAKSKKARVSIHDRYKTATVHLEDGVKIDFATARTEYYSNPGAIPDVELSSLRNDLMRRDFTINAMAIRIDNNDFGALIDFFGGQRDILDKKIRVLHSLSFVDDPARALRAIRFASRLDFTIGVHTERLLKHAVSLNLFSRLKKNKFFTELQLILMEETYLDSFKLMKKYDMLKFISDKLSLDKNKEKLLTSLESLYNKLNKKELKKIVLWKCRLIVILSDFIYNDFIDIIDNLKMNQSTSKKIIQLFSLSKSTAKKIKNLKLAKPSQIYNALCNLKDNELILTAVFSGGKMAELVMDFINNYRHVKPELSGADLIVLGYKKNKSLHNILNEIKLLKIDGEIKNIDDEKNAAIKALDKIRKTE